MQFDFGDGSGDGADGEAPDFSGQEPLGPCPKCGSRVFELPAAYVCEKAVGPEKTCDFRSGRIILQRPIERAQMQKLLATGKTDLLQFVSVAHAPSLRGITSCGSPTARSASNSRRKDAAKARGARRAWRGRAARARRASQGQAAGRVARGRYGPYVKHGGVNATLPDTDQVDSLTLARGARAARRQGGSRAQRPPEQTGTGAQAGREADDSQANRPLRADRERTESRLRVN